MLRQSPTTNAITCSGKRQGVSSDASAACFPTSVWRLPIPGREHSGTARTGWRTSASHEGFPMLILPSAMAAMELRSAWWLHKLSRTYAGAGEISMHTSFVSIAEPRATSLPPCRQFLKRCLCWACQNLPLRCESGSVARTVPRCLGAIPMDDATQVRASRQ